MIANKPTILIYTVQPDDELLREICAGIEEEGVLYEVVIRSSGDANALAAAAAGDSMLGSGIGLRTNAITLGVRCAEGGEPLASYDPATPEQARMLGANSARVIKKQPFHEPQADEQA